MAFAEFTSNNGWDEYQIDKFSVMAIAESFEIKNTNILSEDDLNGHIVKLKQIQKNYSLLLTQEVQCRFKKKNRTAHSTKR